MMRTIPIPIAAAYLAATVASSGVLAQDKPRFEGNLSQRFEQLDRNGDGKLSPTELRAPRLFARFDRNGDGLLSREEMASFAQRTRKRPAARARSSGSSLPADVATRLDVAYGEHDDQRLDVYALNDAKRAPVMVYVHGGGWRRGDKSAVGRKAQFFTGLGWVLVSTNYRLLPEGKHPTNVQDVARALAWVHDHVAEHGGDPERIFLMGHSAGAHLAALVATDERHLKAAGKTLALLKGVIPLDTNAYDLTTLMRSSAAGFYDQVFSGDPKLLRDASPLHHVAADKGIPPMLICYSRGASDRPNPARPAQANAFAKALQGAGVRAQVVDASDRNHGQINARFGIADDHVTQTALSFLEDLQKRPGPTGDERL